MNRLPSRRVPAAGLSLMEAIVVIGIMTMVLLMVDQIFIINYDFVLKELTRSDNDSGAIFAIRRLGESTRGAMTVMASQTINGTTYTTSATTLVLKMPSVDSSGNIVAASYDYIAIYRDAVATTKIFSDISAAGGSVRFSGKKLLTAYNQTMTFSYNNTVPSSATRVSIFLVNQQTVRNTTLTTKAWTSVFLRNF